MDDYKDHPIVYGIIDANDSISYIRIQKAFQSEGHLYEDAQIADSNIYPYKLDVSLKSGNRIIKFDTITIANKEEGTFFSPNYPIYYAPTKNLLNIDLPLELEIRNPKTGHVAKSTTKLMDASKLDIIRPVFVVSLSENFGIDYYSLENISTYQLIIRFHYMEMIPDDSSSIVYKYTDITNELRRSKTLYGEEILRNIFQPDVFFYQINKTIAPTQELVRYNGKLELIIKTIEDSFYTYSENHQASGSALEHQNIYSNIENGYGIFAGKSSKSHFVRIDNLSKLILMDLEGLNFMGSLPEEEQP